MAGTKIQWTDATWNPLRGCSRVSEGCRHCYAEAVAARFSDEGMPYAGLARRTPSGPRWTGEVRLIEEHLTDPLRWKKPRRVFVNSMSDLFHEAVPDWWIDQIFAVMALAPQHTFQLLTKRPERMREYLSHPGRAAQIAVEVFKRFTVLREADVQSRRSVKVWPLPNVWLGVSCEDQATADARIPLLLQTPAAVRFISAEPLLGPVDLHSPVLEADSDGYLDWVIVGGESGPGARPCALEWIRDVANQCRAAGVPCFVKQLGAYVVSEERSAADETEMKGLLGDHTKWPEHRWLWRAGLTDRKGGDPSEWPDDLRVREFPRTPGVDR